MFSQDDVDRAADVCVMGRTVRDQLFGVEDPVGKVIRVNSLPCKVVATVQPKGLSLSGQDQDDTIILLYHGAEKAQGDYLAGRHFVFGGIARRSEDGGAGSDCGAAGPASSASGRRR